MVHLRIAVSFLLVLACTRDGDRTIATRDPWFLDPAQGCQFDSSAVHADPVALVREFVERNGAGEFLGGSEWLSAAVDCPGHEPASDAFTVIRSAAVEPIEVERDSARVEVRYEWLGVSSSGTDGWNFATDPRVEMDTMVVLRSRFGWRIRSPALQPRVTAETALATIAYPAEDRAALEALARP